MEHVTSAEAVEEPAMAEEQRAIEPIAFPEQPEEEHELSKLDQERLKHKARWGAAPSVCRRVVPPPYCFTHTLPALQGGKVWDRVCGARTAP